MWREVLGRCWTFSSRLKSLFYKGFVAHQGRKGGVYAQYLSQNANHYRIIELIEEAVSSMQIFITLFIIYRKKFENRLKCKIYIYSRILVFILHSVADHCDYFALFIHFFFKKVSESKIVSKFDKIKLYYLEKILYLCKRFNMLKYNYN